MPDTINATPTVAGVPDIATTNDSFRRSWSNVLRMPNREPGLGLGRLVLTRGITDLGVDVATDTIERVAHFDTFTEDDDPHGEHDFGSFDLDNGTKIFWKIDYYARRSDGRAEWNFGSDDPHDLNKTARLLTILLADEY